MDLVVVFAVPAIASYLMGAVPFGLLIGRMRGIDIRTVGSRNIGATNVFRTVGKGWGILTFILDFLKGLAATVLIPRLTDLVMYGGSGSLASNTQTGLLLALVCACCSVAGHNWPVYLHFKGGKGVATSTGALVGIAPGAMGIAFGAWVMVFAATHFVSLASITAAIAMAGAGWFFYLQPLGPVLPGVMTGLAAVTILRHISNIRRLMNGTENRIEFGKKKDGNTTNHGDNGKS